MTVHPAIMLYPGTSLVLNVQLEPGLQQYQVLALHVWQEHGRIMDQVDVQPVMLELPHLMELVDALIAPLALLLSLEDYVQIAQMERHQIVEILIAPNV